MPKNIGVFSKCFHWIRWIQWQKKLKSKRKIAGWNPGSPVWETETLPLSHRATGNRADPYIEPNSCLSDFSDSLNSLNSLKVLLHLEKTPLYCYTKFFQLQRFRWIQRKWFNKNSNIRVRRKLTLWSRLLSAEKDIYVHFSSVYVEVKSVACSVRFERHSLKQGILI